MSGQTEPPQMMQQDAIEMQHMAVGGLEIPKCIYPIR